jgi:hypothetical protein
MNNLNPERRTPHAGQRRLQSAALRMARRCRHIVQTCLREEEWADADQEFHAVILDELQRLAKQRDGSQSPVNRSSGNQRNSL